MSSKRLSLILAGLIASALASLLAVVLLLRATTAARDWVDHTYQARIMTEELFGALRDSETGQRGFMLTSDDTYLAPFRDGQTKTPEILAQLGRQLADNPAQRPRLARITALVAQKFEEMDATVLALRSGAKDEAMAMVRTHKGQNVMDAIRTEITAVLATENALLEARTARAATLLNAASWVGSLALAVLIGLAVTLYRYFLAQVRELATTVADRTQHLNIVTAELAHRTKNQIALVQAVANQTARHSSGLPDFLGKFQDRLQALGRSTTELTRHQWRSASLANLLLGQIEWLPPAIARGRITFAGPEVLVSPTAAHYLGLAIHELATNALKYGALSNNQGKIAVFWSKVTTGGEPATFKFTWSETGGPLIEAEAGRPKPGFGSTILARLTAASLSGTSLSDFKPAGLVWTLDAPLARVESAARGDSGAAVDPDIYAREPLPS